MKNCYENLPEEYDNDGNTYCHGVVNCKYYHGDCFFMDTGSGDPDDMPCRARENEILQDFREWKEERQKAFEEALKERPQGDISSMEIVAGKCPIEAGGDCPLRQQGEWIIVKDERLGDNVKCPFCGKELAGTDLNFCCKCGAKLRKGAEQ